MKKFAIFLAVLFLLVLGALALTPMFLSPDFEFEASTTIDTPPEEIYPLIASPKNWEQWSYWHENDPEMIMTYSGAESGTGAEWAWTSAKNGNGAMTLTAADPQSGVTWDLTIEGIGLIQGEIKLAPKGESTEVTWRGWGTADAYYKRWFAFLTPMMMESVNATNLANLKQVAEG